MAEKKYELTGMVTEQANPKTMEMDTFEISEILRVINEEDKTCAFAVEKVLPEIEKIVTALVDRFARGGRILYLGAGTSGRIAIMDSAEFPPRFGIDPDRVQVGMAGGSGSIIRAQEANEDDKTEGSEIVRDWNPSEIDCVIGLATSGKTPYVISGLHEARAAGAFTAFICANPVSDDIADVVVPCITGPEVLTGSTRLKAGTAQKMILNMISTATFVKLGKTYKNRMSHIATKNIKLYKRAIETISVCCDMPEDEAEALLIKAGKELPVALVCGVAKCDIETAKEKLQLTGGKVRAAIEFIGR